MTSLGRWLVDILNAHTERHNVPAAGPAPDSPLARFYIGQLDVDLPPMIPRPCWACGIRAAFDAHVCGKPASVVDRLLAQYDTGGAG